MKVSEVQGMACAAAGWLSVHILVSMTVLMDKQPAGATGESYEESLPRHSPLLPKQSPTLLGMFEPWREAVSAVRRTLSASQSHPFI